MHKLEAINMVGSLPSKIWRIKHVFYDMPGSNCCIVGCGSSRRKQNLGIFKLPKAVNSEYSKWRADLLEIILRTRELDVDFKQQIQDDKISICELHFKPEDLDICKFFFPQLFISMASHSLCLLSLLSYKMS